MRLAKLEDRTDTAAKFDPWACPLTDGTGDLAVYVPADGMEVFTAARGVAIRASREVWDAIARAVATTTANTCGPRLGAFKGETKMTEYDPSWFDPENGERGIGWARGNTSRGSHHLPEDLFDLLPDHRTYRDSVAALPADVRDDFGRTPGYFEYPTEDAARQSLRTARKALAAKRHREAC